MSARTEIWLAAALLIAMAGNAGAASLSPSFSPTPNDPASAPDAPNSNAPAYNQAAVSDPYNRPDFSSGQSFGLVAGQMLGAAAACEQLHSESMSLSGMQAAKNAKTPTDRSDIDVAQQNMLDPVSTTGGTLKHGGEDCDRLAGSFDKLQQIQLHNQNLTHELDQADAMYPTTPAKKRR
jgi:hypothetical protein